MIVYRYRRWDGTQELLGLHPDELMNEISDDLMSHGDLARALQRLMQRGLNRPNGSRMQGIQDMMQQLRNRRQQTLDNYNLGSVFDQINEKLDDIIRTERGGIEQRLQDAQAQSGKPKGGEPQDAQGSEGQPQAGHEGAGEPQDAEGVPSGQRSTGSQEGEGEPPAGGQQQQGGEQQGGQGDLADIMKHIASKKLPFLDGLPPDAPGRIQQLSDYDFVDQEAKRKFDELMDMLKQQMMQSYFNQMAQQIKNLTPEDMQRMRQMMQRLNEMLREKRQGGEPDFDQFMKEFGDFFGGENGPQSLDELIEQMQRQIAQMQSLLDSLPREMREQLRDMLQSVMQDAGLQEQLSELMANLEYHLPLRQMRNQYNFRGDEPLDLQQAMKLMEQLQNMDELEKQLRRAQQGGGLDQVEEDLLRDVLGDEAAQNLEQLEKLQQMLEDAGYIHRVGNKLELTPRGMRKIGHKALQDIFAQLKKDRAGRHSTRLFGPTGEKADELKSYEFGDPFHLQLEKTLSNAIFREGPGVPVRLKKEDFEVYRSELLSTASTVLMLDLSWSMGLRGSFFAAKKVALALHSLIRTQYPRDSLYVVGFSNYAREIKMDDLAKIGWDEFQPPGTNMHHA
ncbi:MAG: VWA domain-containing protein, partial [Chloroflexi bacterium]|nr:VWA domain-containing protein [Chloroflexota bacterium]